jgi:hypothetical protein
LKGKKVSVTSKPTNSMEQNPSSGANIHSVGQKNGSQRFIIISMTVNITTHLNSATGIEYKK